MLKMLDMLRLEPGQRVFELGTASGWNAALMGRLVGPAGYVYSLEIIPDLAQRAAANIAQLNINNVSVIERDAGDGYAEGAPYDRAMFTAGTYDSPHAFFEQIRDGGLLLAVIKNEGGGDNLFLLRKTRDHFESLESLTVAFVQMVGKYRLEGLDPKVLETTQEWEELKDRRVHVRPFWWGAKAVKDIFGFRTVGIRSYLSISEPLFETFTTRGAGNVPVPEQYFGLWDPDSRSLVVSKDDSLISYGSLAAEHKLIEHIHKWVDLGMPNAASFDLKVYPINANVQLGHNEWIVKRKEAQFLWSLPESESGSENRR